MVNITNLPIITKADIRYNKVADSLRQQRAKLKELDETIYKLAVKYNEFKTERQKAAIKAVIHPLYVQRNYFLWLALRTSVQLVAVYIYGPEWRANVKRVGKQKATEIAEQQMNILRTRSDIKALGIDVDRLHYEAVDPGISAAGIESVATGAVEALGVIIGTAVAALSSSGGSSSEEKVEMQNLPPAPAVISQARTLDELSMRYSQLRMLNDFLNNRYGEYFGDNRLNVPVNGNFITISEIRTIAGTQAEQAIDDLKDYVRQIEKGADPNSAEMQRRYEDLLGSFSYDDLSLEDFSTMMELYRKLMHTRNRADTRKYREEFNKLMSEFKKKVTDNLTKSEGERVVERNVPLASDIQAIIYGLLTQEKAIVNLPQGLYQLVHKKNPALWAEIGALIHNILGEDFYVDLLKIPPSSKDAAGRRIVVNKIVQQIVNQTGKKLELLRQLNDLILWHFRDGLERYKNDPTLRNAVRRDLGIKNREVTDDDINRWIESRMFQDPSKDAKIPELSEDTGLYKKQVFEPLNRGIFQMFMDVGVLTQEQAQQFTLDLINYVQSTTDFWDIRQEIQEGKSDYIQNVNDAIGLVIDEATKIIEEFKLKLSKTYIDIPKVAGLIKEAIDNFKSQKSFSLRDKLAYIRNAFKKIEDEKLKPVEPAGDEPGPPPPIEPIDEKDLDPANIRDAMDAPEEVFEEEVKRDPAGVARAINELQSTVIAQAGGFQIVGRELKEPLRVDGSDIPDASQVIEFRTPQGQKKRFTTAQIVALIVAMGGLIGGIIGTWDYIKSGRDPYPPPPPEPQPPRPPGPGPDPPGPDPPGPDPPGPTPPDPVPPVIPDDDPHSFVETPPATGSIAATVVDPAENDLFVSTEEEKKEEDANFIKFSIVPPLNNGLKNPLIFDNFMSQNKRFTNTYPNPKVPPTKYVDIPRNNQPVFQDVHFDVFDRRKPSLNQRQDGGYTECKFTEVTPRDPMLQNYAHSNYYPDRALIGSTRQPYYGNTLTWKRNDGTDRYSSKDPFYEGGYANQRQLDKTLYKSKKYNFNIDSFYSVKGQLRR